MSEDLEQALGPDRRTFVKRLVIGTAFAAPIVSSFTMSGVKAVFGATPSGIVGGFNCNTGTQPPAPEDFPDEIVCVQVGKGATDVNVPDGAVSLNLLIPDGALPLDTQVCIYRGDLAALASRFPADHPPISAYAVVWLYCPASLPLTPDATSPITLTVTGATPVAAGDPVYELDKSTGKPGQTAVASGAGAWSASFTKDPGLVVTDTPAASGGAASPIVAQATTTG